RHDFRILRDRQRLVRECAQDDRDDREDDGEDRPVDEEAREVHGASVVEVKGGMVVRSASTGAPGWTRCTPATTPQSSTPSPSRTTRRPSTNGPVATRRYCALLSPSTT